MTWDRRGGAPAIGAGGAASVHGQAPGRSTQVQRIQRQAASSAPGGQAPGRSTQVQRLGSAGPGGPAAGGADAVTAAVRDGGGPLPAGPRARFEASLGADLGGVRVHDGPASQAAAAQLGANAFTVGRDIHFAPGQYQPDATSGMHLLAHEVAHTVQQGGGAPGGGRGPGAGVGAGPGVQAKREVSQPGDPAEVEADRFADHVVHGGAMPALSGAAPSVQRQEAEATPEGEAPAPQCAGETAPDQAFYQRVSNAIRELLAEYHGLDISVEVDPPGAAPEATETPETAPEATETAPEATETAPEATETAPEATETPPEATETPETEGETEGETPREMTTAEINVPYWNNKYPGSSGSGDFENPRPPQDFDAVTRDLEIQQFVDVLVSSKTKATSDRTQPEWQEFNEVAEAKGSPGEIQQFVQDAVDLGVIDPPLRAHVTNADDSDPALREQGWKAAWEAVIQQWMVEVGVGVDCNGLVYQALLRAQRDVGAITTGDDRLPDNQEHNGALDYWLGHVTSVSVEGLGGLPDPDLDGDEVIHYNHLGLEVPSAYDLLPGDVMQIPGHVRIVMSVEPCTAQTADDGVTQLRVIEFTTAESTVDGRQAAGETYEGPREHYWRWDGTTLSHRYEGSTEDDWVDSGETPNYRRHILPPSELPEGAS